MSILASAPRYHRSTMSVETSLISWSDPASDLWVGSIDLDYAGMVERIDGRYYVTDWKNERVGDFKSLTEAQRSLEPARRVSEADRVHRELERNRWIVSSTATAVIVTAAMLGSWAVTAA